MDIFTLVSVGYGESRDEAYESAIEIKQINPYVLPPHRELGRETIYERVVDTQRGWIGYQCKIIIGYEDLTCLN